jgi:hypothetical protein
MKPFIIPPIFALLLCGDSFAQVLLIAQQPTLAPACVCQGPTDPKCVCGKACQCVPATPKPAVSVMFPKQISGTCPNGQCFPQIAPKAIVQKQNIPGAPLAKANVHQGPVSFICENGVCRPVQAPASKPAGSREPVAMSPTQGACSSCSGVRSYPVRRGLFGWRR